ncbi:MAG: Hpt domain-containing protein [bacterium]|nr:Hpt domain-containing protein [bacterium]
MAVNDQVFDFDAALAAIDGDTELFGKLAEAFQLEAQSLRDRLSSGLAADDFLKVRRAAHSLMGPLQLFSATKLAKLAQQLEQACLNEDRGEAEGCINRLDAGVAKLQDSLQTHFDCDSAQ